MVLRLLTSGVDRAAYGGAMTESPASSDPTAPDQDSVDGRAHLLPEELAVGSADPQRQAELILEESAERTLDPEGTQDSSSQVP